MIVNIIEPRINSGWCAAMNRRADISEWPDERLVHECREGNSEAWDLLMSRFGPLIYGISRRFRLSSEDCVDAFGQVCKILLENLSKLRSADSLGGYISITTRRVCLAILRSRERRVLLEQRVIDEKAYPTQLEVDPDNVARAALRACTVHRALSQQDERCRKLLELLFFCDEQPEYDEISRRLKLPVPSIGPTRGRCLEKFHRTLKAMGFQE